MSFAWGVGMKVGFVLAVGSREGVVHEKWARV